MEGEGEGKGRQEPIVPPWETKGMRMKFSLTL